MVWIERDVEKSRVLSVLLNKVVKVVKVVFYQFIKHDFGVDRKSVYFAGPLSLIYTVASIFTLIQSGQTRCRQMMPKNFGNDSSKT